jgi:murein DD-endopeptidase MepM/ murein hydrolase activator NlpD
MRFTDFGSVVKTYKKNFQLRKKTFIAERKAIQEKKKKDREDRIEAVKAIQPLIKIKESASKKSNFLGDIKKFLGLMLAGFILQNLKTILPILQEIYKKIEDLVKGTKEFVEGVIGGLQSFFEGLDGAKKRMDDLLSPILNTDLSKFVPFQDQLDKVLTGVLGIAALITGLYQGGKASGDGNLIDETAKGSAAGVDLAAQRKAARLKALNQAKELRAQKQAQRIAAREAAKAVAEEAKRTEALRDAANLRKQANIASGSTRRRLNKQVQRLEKIVGGDDTSSVATATADKPGQPGQKTLRKKSKNLAFKEFSNDLKAAKAAADAAKPGPIPSLRTFLKKALDRNFKSQELANPAVSDITEDIARSNMFDDLAKEFADEFEGKKPFSTIGKEAPTAPRGNLITPKLFKGIFGPPKPSATPSSDIVSKFNQIMKNARGFIKPKNLRLLGGFAKDLGAGLAIEFFAGWAIDRGLEAIGRDEKTLLKERVLRFNRLSKEEQKSIIETYNNNLEKELEYQKTFFAKVDKVIALGDMTANEIKIKALASFLTAVSISGAGSVYDLVSAGPLPDYLESDVDIELTTQAKPSFAKISTPSGMPPLPPTGTGSAALAAAQQYGAARPGGRKHAGVDFDPADDKNSKFYSRIGGEVIYAKNAGGGYGNVVDIYNKELGYTERIAEGNRIHVKVGDVVNPGTLVQSGSEMTGVFHYEIRKGKAGDSGLFEGTVNPLEFLKNLKPPEEVSMKSSPSNITSSAGLNQSTTYSESGVAIRREVNNIIIPIAA